LPLLPDMPVMICDNLDVQGGIINGSHSILRHVQYMEDEEGLRYATSAVVSIPDSSPDTFADLPPHDCVILQKPSAMKVIH
ncbi:uncharacterized protein EI90DRAFT_2846099, partial [Cantharellus anzutake]|uniref:uncharacterized protein n=1 Tax=Cantharellus anzutake TaxID=1750568 RepID=UPI001908728C